MAVSLKISSTYRILERAVFCVSQRLDERLHDRANRQATAERWGGISWDHITVTDPTGQRQLQELRLLRRVRDRIDREYAQPLNVNELARGANLSAGHLARQFKLAYGESPYSYLMTRRIERAMTFLRRGDLSVTDVCFAVGYSSLATFSTRFTELVGVVPSIYRRQSARETAGIPSCVKKQVTRPVRNREALLHPAPVSSLA